MHVYTTKYLYYLYWANLVRISVALYTRLSLLLPQHTQENMIKILSHQHGVSMFVVCMCVYCSTAKSDRVSDGCCLRKMLINTGVCVCVRAHVHKKEETKSRKSVCRSCMAALTWLSLVQCTTAWPCSTLWELNPNRFSSLSLCVCLTLTLVGKGRRGGELLRLGPTY